MGCFIKYLQIFILWFNVTLGDASIRLNCGLSEMGCNSVDLFQLCGPVGGFRRGLILM
jgi:hypothetical protein